MRAPEPDGPVASLSEGGFARARILQDSGGTTCQGGGAWVLTSSRCVALRYGSGKKKPAVQCAGFLDGQD